MSAAPKFVPHGNHEQESTVDVRMLMAEIRAKVLADVENNRDKALQFNAYKADFEKGQQCKAGGLLNSEELRYLNQNHAYAFQSRAALEKLSSHRFGALGQFIVRIKRKIGAILWDSIFKDYFEQERDYQANLVRYLNQVSRYVDHRDASNFWELIRKIDVDITNAIERIERIRDEQDGNVRRSEQEIYRSIHSVATDVSKLTEKMGSLGAAVETLESVARGLEAIVSRASKNGSAEPVHFSSDQSYLLLENRWRGSERLISSRQEIYPPLFRADLGPVLEIGGGRGELQLLFKSHGIPSYNVEADGAMVEEQQSKGLKPVLGDGIAHLSELPDQSLGGVIALQVVEHLPWKILEKLFLLCQRKVKSGGVVIFETINPRSVVSLSSNYFRDPTHVWPLHPDTLSYQMSLSGLKIKEVRYLSPISHEAGLQPIQVENFMTPRWKDTLASINHNFERLHDLLYGCQDYAIIAEVP